jgi:hypothetical protein
MDTLTPKPKFVIKRGHRISQVDRLPEQTFYWEFYLDGELNSKSYPPEGFTTRAECLDSIRRIKSTGLDGEIDSDDSETLSS